MDNISRPPREVQRAEILAVVTPNIHHLFPERFVVESRDPFDFLFHHLRFDLMFKYIYASAFIHYLNSDWFKELYAVHIKAMSPEYEERDGSGKKGKEAYFESFHNLIRSLSEDGFDENKSLVVVNDDNMVVSGAHRVAAAAALGKPIVVARIPYRGHNFSADYFRNNGLPEDVLDYAAFEYCRLNKRSYIATVFPKAKNKDVEITQILETMGKCYYRKDVKLFNHGPHNLMKVAYADAPWVGTPENNYGGAAFRAQECFDKQDKMRIWVFSADSLEVVKDAKQKIRALFSLGNNSIHINDMHEQTVSMAQALLNNNSIHFLNWADPKEPNGLLGFIWDSLACFVEKEIDIDKCCVDGSAVMAAYGIRPARDIDFVHLDNIPSSLFDGSKKMGSHNTEEKYHAKPVAEIVLNPQNHFYFLGLKFLSLPLLRDFKARRNETKDVKDVSFINYFLKTGKVSFRQLFLGAIQSIKNQAHAKIPIWARYPYYGLRAIWRFIRNTYIGWKPIVVNAFTRDKIYTISYKGFSVCYSYGNSLIDWIKANGSYKPEFSQMLIKGIKNQTNPVFLDIGANIGLISLNVLAEAPQTKIYAFEPGPHQARLFESTIALNRLKERIALLPYALGEKEEVKSFVMHQTINASGDGFVDTGRAGQFNTISVTVRTLDDWWQEMSQPQVHTIKINIEGAELWALRGGSVLIQSCEPHIFLEIHPVNLANYPYTAKDILAFFGQRQYVLKTLTNFDVNEANIDMILKISTNFLAYPRSQPGPF